ncbi:MAG: TraR/DksA family transcriptional regulator [Elusimicrobia bacterium]|nr:TraR/DksA family transcriptional regulator [Elusimicrobiota bacterium]
MKKQIKNSKTAKKSKASSVLKRPINKTKAKKAADKDLKKKVNQTLIFSPKELSEIEKSLTERKNDLIKNIEDKRNYDLKESEVGDQIDEASDSLDKEILFGSSENERKILDEIEAALRRIKNGIYGKCEQCGIIIDKKRIKALPYSRYCIKCQIKNDSYK